MSPRVEIIGDATLYLGDCCAVLPSLSDVDAARALITDPPYGVSIKTMTVKSKRNRDYRDKSYWTEHGYNWSAIVGDDQPFDPSHLLAFRNLVLWGANNYADRLPPSSCWFSWDRKAGKAADSDITDCELAWVRGLPFKTVRQFTHMWAGFQRDSETGERHLHPTQKPAALFAWCISFFSGCNTVIDPYMGVGACGVACARLGRRFIGVEIEERYFDIACRRIEDAQRQGDLLNHLSPAEDPADTRMADLFTEPED